MGAAGTEIPTPPAPVTSDVFAKYGKFLIVGLTGVVVNLIVFTLVLEAIAPSASANFWQSILHFASSRTVSPLDAFVASAIAFGVATLWNFLLNNLWTFRSGTGHRHPLGRRLGLYYGVSLGSLAVNEAILFGLGFYLPPLVAQAIGILAGSVVGFLGNYRVTFAPAHPPAAPVDQPKA